MSRLHTTFNELASNFAHAVLAAVWRASLDDLFSEPRPRRGRQPRGRGAFTRRSPEELQKVADRIVAVVKAHPNGIGAEAIKKKMGMKSGQRWVKIFIKPMSLALASKKITKRGKLRDTVYFG